MSNHKAVVCQLKNVRKHPNADKLQLAEALGCTVVVGLDSKEEDIGIYFNCELQLSHEFCHNNNLYSNPEHNKDTSKKGYFGPTRRVRAQAFRGQKSDGFFVPTSYLDFASETRHTLSPGYEFDSFNDIPICNKYFTPETVKAQANNEAKPKKKIASFPEHVETNNFFKEIGNIHDGSILYITEKLHGTSGRFGYVETKVTNKWWQKVLKFIGINHSYLTYEHYLGSRRVVLGNKSRNPYYKRDDFREESIKHLYNNLHPGEVIYFELVGYTNETSQIQKGFDYGCGIGNCKLFVYRIIKSDYKGNYVEYSWPQVKRRCEELELAMVPEIGTGLPHIYKYEQKDSIEFGVNEYMEGNSMLTDNHIREGVVVRVDPPIGKPYFLKAKSYAFKVKEGLIKEQDDFVDVEEIS